MRVVAIYPGTFDPPTKGHADIIERASNLFDNVIVAIGKNSHKVPLLTVEERLEALTAISKPHKNVSVESFDGLLVEGRISITTCGGEDTIVGELVLLV